MIENRLSDGEIGTVLHVGFLKVAFGDEFEDGFGLVNELVEDPTIGLVETLTIGIPCERQGRLQ